MDETTVLNQLLNALPDPVFYQDLNGVYRGCNQAFAEYMGQPAEAIIGKTDRDLAPDSQMPGAAPPAVSARTAETTVTRREWLTYPDGRQTLVEWQQNPLRDPAGQTIGVLGWPGTSPYWKRQDGVLSLRPPASGPFLKASGT
jgi:PAS domain S-box-containing protein